jgi:molybdate transport system substrate-binding protein
MPPSPSRRSLLYFGAGLMAGGHARAENRDAPLVFAAASLRSVLDAVIDAWRVKTGREVRAAYAASSLLARQIEAGAAADLFISADLDWMDELERKGLIARATRRNLASNRLALIAPADSPAMVRLERRGAIAAALGQGRLSVAAPDVPAGRYAREALARTGQMQELASRFINADNVRTALLYVARGEAPLGVVYDTDAAQERRVRVVALFPENSHAPIVYPAALVSGPVRPGAAPFLRFLQGEEAAGIFRKFGFRPLPPPRN